MFELLKPTWIRASFTNDALTFTAEKSTRTVSFPYCRHPEVFGHPRFLMIDLDKSDAIVRSALRQLTNPRTFLAPRVIVSFDRPVHGGITEMDKREIADIFTHAGACKVIFNTVQ